jgi:glycosyltransferase involved in cell wall biosynthesis
VTAEGYVLITPARNEEAHIEKTITAVVAQTCPPNEWVIVSDGSTDRTEAIVRDYLPKHAFMRLVRTSGARERSFAAKVGAFRSGYSQVRDRRYAFIGNLDGDVSFEPDYHQRILARFRADDRLGIAGGYIHEESVRGFLPRAFNATRSVAGAVQLFRRECYDAIGGYAPLKYGGIDTWAEVMARMAGWRVQSFPDIRVFHHRRTGSAAGKRLKSRFIQGRADFALGNHPVFEVLRCVWRIPEDPCVLGVLARAAGFAWEATRRHQRAVAPEFVEYLRREQMQRVRSLLPRRRGPAEPARSDGVVIGR